MIFHVAKDEGCTFHGRERKHGAFATTHSFVVQQFAFWVEARGDSDVFSGRTGLDGDGVPREIAGAAIDEIEGAVHGDAIDPGAEGGLFAEA